MDSTASPKSEDNEKVRVCSSAHNTSGVEGCVGAPRWD